MRSSSDSPLRPSSPSCAGRMGSGSVIRRRCTRPRRLSPSGGPGYGLGRHRPPSRKQFFLTTPKAYLAKYVAAINNYFGYLVSSAQETKRNPNTVKKSAPPTIMITHSITLPTGTDLYSPFSRRVCTDGSEGSLCATLLGFRGFAISPKPRALCKACHRPTDSTNRLALSPQRVRHQPSLR